jgi:STE24 endopeptidase
VVADQATPYASDVSVFRLTFLAVVVVALVVRLWLAARQASHVSKHSSEVPAAFRDRISLAAHQKAAEYTIARNRLAMTANVVDFVVVLAWTFAGGLSWLNDFWHDATPATLAGDLALVVSLVLVDSLAGLALSAWSAFQVERRFAFNRTTPRLFAIDALKGTVLLLLLGIPLGWSGLWLMDNGGRLWWLDAWACWLAFSLAISWAYPVLIAPRFNKFAPLQDESLKQQIEALLIRCGFRASGIFVMDGSRRSAHVNAYFTGLGASKRVVFFDTLLADLRPRELLAILAHELGHYRLRHIQRQLVLSGIAGLAGLGLLAWLIGQNWFYSGLLVSSPSDGAAFALFLIAGPAFAFFLTPLFAALSRRFEEEADDFAARQTGTGDLVDALVKLYHQNATTLTPDPIYSAFYNSHPSASVRVSRLLRRGD